jgi:phosphoglycolate phosphatase-like HAD superfamily hydrolase
MDIRAVVFDVNGTLVRIRTDDGMEQIFRSVAHFLTYQGIDLHRHQVRDLYFEQMKEQRQASPEQHPEFDAVGIWRSIIQAHQTEFTRALPAEKLEQLPLFLAEMYRGISRCRLRLYPHVREVLDVLRERCPLAVVTATRRAPTRAPSSTRLVCSTTSTRSSSPGTTGTASPTDGSSSSPSTGWAWRPSTRCTSATTCTVTSSEHRRPA